MIKTSLQKEQDLRWRKTSGAPLLHLSGGLGAVLRLEGAKKKRRKREKSLVPVSAGGDRNLHMGHGGSRL